MFLPDVEVEKNDVVHVFWHTHFRSRNKAVRMSNDVPDEQTARELANTYADSECVGQLGDITDIEEYDTEWLVEFETHTLSDTYTHRVQITKSVGNVLSHDRSSRFD